MKTLVKKTLAAVAALTLGTQAFAVSGDTTVNINFPNIVILHYVSDVTFDIPLGALDDSIDEGISGSLSIISGLNISGTTGMTVAVDAAGGYSGTIIDAWAVRALTGAGGVDVSIGITKATAEDATNVSKVTILDATVTDGTTTGGLINFPSPGMGASKAVYGNVMFNMNFEEVILAGSHDGAKYTVTAVEH